MNNGRHVDFIQTKILQQLDSVNLYTSKFFLLFPPPSLESESLLPELVLPSGLERKVRTYTEKFWELRISSSEPGPTIPPGACPLILKIADFATTFKLNHF